MIHSLFIINASGDVFMEKHWKTVVGKSICDYFFEAQSKCANAEDVPPVIATPHHYLINIFRNNLYFVAVLTNEIAPLFVIEFLHRIVEVFEDYFTECTETSLKDNYVIVYELLDEMLDSGLPLATETNILKELIKPPNIFRKVANLVTGDSTNISNVLPSSQLSNIPWRRMGVKYTNNESYFDLIEEIDAIIDRNGATVMCEIQGYVSEHKNEKNIELKYSFEIHCLLLLHTSVDMSREHAKRLAVGMESGITWRKVGIVHRTTNEILFDIIESFDAIIDQRGMIITAEISGVIDCCVKLSGMPDLTLSFINPRLLDDVSFHPCVRLKKWESERVLSFIPPDGNFRLISYHIGTQNSISIPVYVKHNIQFREGSGGRFELTVGPKQTMGKTLEAVVIECTMPKSVLNCTLTPTQGKCTFDPVKKILVWDIGKIESNAQSAARLPSLRGNIVLSTGQPIPESNPILNVRFTLNQIAISGIRVQRVDMHGEKYKPFKGVKYITTVKKGRFQIRT
ncbi:unnamed protein product [Rotaria socialis]|uniref:MHD domain-containing protein n=4 Tax=Rotaria socialis TaxID=392032 RepID=A0A818EQS3_9BILA|nr:unnamed protein product [Rotaria socialis]CAF3462903.1 unnamed protein product [Rotaria socialis]CAF4289429.1 unnamed protein product [Rotaria socialis]CAF4290774.1 unnamed protein product [Rotaria socialis]